MYGIIVEIRNIWSQYQNTLVAFFLSYWKMKLNDIMRLKLANKEQERRAFRLITITCTCGKPYDCDRAGPYKCPKCGKRWNIDPDLDEP